MAVSPLSDHQPENEPFCKGSRKLCRRTGLPDCKKTWWGGKSMGIWHGGRGGGIAFTIRTGLFYRETRPHVPTRSVGHIRTFTVHKNDGQYDERPFLHVSVHTLGFAQWTRILRFVQKFAKKIFSSQRKFS